MRQIHQFSGMSCFEICHHNDCKYLFVNIHGGNQIYSRSLRNHPVRSMIGELYQVELPRNIERTVRVRPTNTAQNHDNRTTATYVYIVIEKNISPNPRVRKRTTQRKSASIVRKVMRK